MFTSRSLFVLIWLWSVTAALAASPELRGLGRAVDGDTLSLNGVNIRLFGIDAPERGQTCEKNGNAWACGGFAMAVLQAQADGKMLRCEVKVAADRYGRPVAVCWAQGVELARYLVAAGAALAYHRYSDRYAADEAVARAARIGIWAGRMVLPQDFRRRDAFPAISACKIKGNIGKSGRIFHLPGQKHYPRTKVDITRREAWFCTTSEAVAAGYRAALR